MEPDKNLQSECKINKPVNILERLYFIKLKTLCNIYFPSISSRDLLYDVARWQTSEQKLDKHEFKVTTLSKKISIFHGRNIFGPKTFLNQILCTTIFRQHAASNGFVRAFRSFISCVQKN